MLTKGEMRMLVDDLSNFTGTENWYRHNLMHDTVYTDGVKYFAEKAGAYWFLDIVDTELFPLQKKEGFLSITMTVANEQASIVATDGNLTTLWNKEISFTDCPDGEYRFYFTDNVLLLTSEY
jgi:hypothetical protein